MRMHHTTTIINTKGLLAELRALRPPRRLTGHEARSVAERQAALLIKRTGSDFPVQLDVLTAIPRLRVQLDGELPDRVAGSSHWTGTHWLINLNANHSEGRVRFSAFHELFHIIEHRFCRFENSAAAEQLADHFSACVLMPRPVIKQAWSNGIQDRTELADLFGVSEAAIRFRLLKLRLIDPTEHTCRATRRIYYRLGPPKPLQIAIPAGGRP
jgi:hypothetical protein